MATKDGWLVITQNYSIHIFLHLMFCSTCVSVSLTPVTSPSLPGEAPQWHLRDSVKDASEKAKGAAMAATEKAKTLASAATPQKPSQYV